MKCRGPSRNHLRVCITLSSITICRITLLRQTTLFNFNSHFISQLRDRLTFQNRSARNGICGDGSYSDQHNGYTWDSDVSEVCMAYREEDYFSGLTSVLRSSEGLHSMVPYLFIVFRRERKHGFALEKISNSSLSFFRFAGFLPAELQFRECLRLAPPSDDR